MRVRPEVFERVPRSLLEQAFYLVGQLAKPAEEHSNEELLRSYRGIRRFLPTLLRLLTFQCAREGQVAVFTLPEAIARGEMRPLREPEEPALSLASAATSEA